MTNAHVMIFLLVILALSIFAPISYSIAVWFICWFAPVLYNCSPGWYN